MKISHKLTFGFVSVALLVTVVGYISINASQKALKESIGEQSSALASEMLKNIDKSIYTRIESFQEYSKDSITQQIISISNKEFENFDDIQAYLNEKDGQWTSTPKQEVTPFMQGLIDNELSKELREKLSFYEEKYGYQVFGEVFVTNKYGANIAQSGKTTDYYQADETWWQKAKEDGLYVADVEYDDSAGVYSVDICLRIDGENGNFLGVIKVVANIKEVISLIKEEEAAQESDHKTHQFKLLTRDLRIIYSTEEFEILEFLSTKLAAILHSGNDNYDTLNYFVAAGDTEGEGKELFAHAHSRGYKEFKGLGWILVTELKTEKVFAPVAKLKARILIISLVVTVIAVLLGFFISKSISRPIGKLVVAAVKIGEGDMEARVDINSKDETGQLANTFNIMIEDLKNTTTSIDNLNREVAERQKAEIVQRESEKRISHLSRLKEELLAPAAIGEKLKLITDAIVEIFDADFARVWIIKPGNLCDSGCVHAEVKEGAHVCRHRGRCLHLLASSGRYTHIDGKVHRRVPFGCYKIGRVAAGTDSKFITNDVTHDPRVHNHDWAKELGLVSFGGYRLISTEGKPIGVLALFSKHVISSNDDTMLETLASTASQVFLTTEAEKALKQSEIRFKTIFENAGGAIFTADAKTGKLLQCNSLAEKLIGRQRTEIIGMHQSLLHPESEAEKYEEKFRCHVEQGHAFDFEGVVQHKDGRKVPVLISAESMEIDGRDIIIGLFIDITERKKAEETQNKLNKELELTIKRLSRSNKELQEFAHIAAHDLKAPLRAIGTLADWISTDYGDLFDEEGREKVKLISARAERMSGHIDSVLQYSGVGRVVRKKGEVDLNSLVKEIIAELSPPENIEIEVCSVLPFITCERAQIMEVFRHLLKNAMKYMDKAEGRIRIDCVEEDFFWKFSVSDNGPGIEEKYFQKVFEIFQTLSPRDEVEGNGVGLSVVKKIVELYSGKIWLESKAGEGSTFFFTLPKQESEVVDDAQLEAHIANRR